MATTTDDALHRTFEIPGYGSFRIRRPGFLDYASITRNKIALVGDAPPDEAGATAAYIMAVVNVLCDPKPRGFTWESAYDWEPWLQFIEEYHSWLNSFRPLIQGPSRQITDPVDGA
jgi:hypothetical protein